MIRTSIRARLISSFTTAILIPCLISAGVGVWLIYHHIYTQAQAQVNADIEGAREICRNSLERLEHAIRIHATRMVIYGALGRNDRSSLEPEMERVRQAERLDILTVTDARGIVFYRTQSPFNAGDSRSADELVRRVIHTNTSLSSIWIVPEEELARESPALADQAYMDITPTPMASPSE